MKYNVVVCGTTRLEFFFGKGTGSFDHSSIFRRSILLCSLPSRGLGTRVNGGQEGDTCHAHGRLRPEKKKALGEGREVAIYWQASKGGKGSKDEPPAARRGR